jgi:DNA-binding HxlR family transcriptional regulator
MAAVEQVEQRHLTVRSGEAVVLADARHRQPPPFGAERIARAIELLLANQQVLPRGQPFLGSHYLRQFSEFERRLGIASNVLAKRLDGFVADGLMELRAAADGSPGTEYILTRKGHELGLVVMALTAWGDHWAAPDGPPIRFEHGACGGPVRTVAECESCGHTPDIAEVTAAPGPGARAEPSLSG